MTTYRIVFLPGELGLKPRRLRQGVSNLSSRTKIEFKAPIEIDET